jgi:hypothetical protein
MRQVAITHLESDTLDGNQYEILSLAAETGGQTLDAFLDSILVGFSTTLVGLRGVVPYLHSYVTVIAPDFQCTAIKHKIRLAQRADGMRCGFDHMEWTSDPLILSEAYLDIVRLGAISRTYFSWSPLDKPRIRRSKAQAKTICWRNGGGVPAACSTFWQAIYLPVLPEVQSALLQQPIGQEDYRNPSFVSTSSRSSTTAGSLQDLNERRREGNTYCPIAHPSELVF